MTFARIWDRAARETGDPVVGLALIVPALLQPMRPIWNAMREPPDLAPLRYHSGASRLGNRGAHSPSPHRERGGDNCLEAALSGSREVFKLLSVSSLYRFHQIPFRPR